MSSGRAPVARRRFTARAVLTVLAVVAALLAAAPPASADPGIPAGEQPQRIITYDVRTRGTVGADVGVFRRIAAKTLNDRRGWSLGGSVRYREVPSGGSFTLWLAEPSTLPGFSSVCSPDYSCRVGRDVVINDLRWRTGTSTWTDVAEYRHYVINHEVGHWLGLGHTGCSAPGAPAAVMQQQSIGLDGCLSNTWPLAGERQAVAGRHGATARSTRPDLYVLKQDGATGTEVHVLEGANQYRSWQAHLPTVSPTTAPADWEWAVADRDRDGVDDVIGIKRLGASGRLEVHVLDGASGYRGWQLHAATSLPATSSTAWSFDVADVDGDGNLDVVAVNRRGSAGRTTVHVLDGARNFGRTLRYVVTPLGHTSETVWSFATGDHDRDGVPDLYVINRRGSTGRTAVHVLDGARGFREWSAHRASALAATDSGWEFTVDDLDGDGWDEVYAIARQGRSGATEVHVLRDRDYAAFSLHVATPSGTTLGRPGWRFAVD